MADVTDVESALVSFIAQVLYPQGTSAPSSVGVPVMVYAGWPTADTLDKDLRAGKVHVSVFPTNIERNTSRYKMDWQTVSEPVQTITAALAGQTITIGGTVATPQNVMAMVDRRPYIYAVQAGDTLTSIATGLAALIPGATSLGAVVTCSALSLPTVARVGAAGTSIMVLRNQERVMTLTVWADTPAHRKTVTEAVDVALAGISFLTMSDQTQARLIYRNSHVDDSQQKAKLYRRDLFYNVDYATTITEAEMQITQTQLNVKAAVAGVEPYTNVATIFD